MRCRTNTRTELQGPEASASFQNKANQILFGPAAKEIVAAETRAVFECKRGTFGISDIARAINNHLAQSINRCHQHLVHVIHACLDAVVIVAPHLRGYIITARE